MVALTIKHRPLQSRATKSAHTPRPEFRAPEYGQGQKTVLHRYLDAQFVQRFNQDLHNQNLDNHQWQTQDRMGDFHDLVTLRQPVHRTFYMISCELNCSKMSKPALDANRVKSAGFVIRRQEKNGHSIWLQENGQAGGWHFQSNSADALLEPDIYRRLCNAGIAQRRFPAPAYSGEEIHPMRTTQTRDKQGQLRTILHGYLPIGGGYTPKAQTSLDEDSTQSLLSTLPWPSDGLGTAIYQPGNWHDADGVLAQNGQASRRLVQLLRLAINRYHIFDSDQSNNTELMNKFNTLILRSPHGHQGIKSLSDYLNNMFNQNDGQALHEWLARMTEAENTSRQNPAHDDNTLLGSLPFGPHDSQLIISESDAQDINTIMSWRLEQQVLDITQDMPLPKFEQDESDRYFVVPFIRVEECCREEIIWGEASQLFRVAAPFDPEASRPAMIQMPRFKDLKRGIANGVSFISPPDMADQLRAMKPTEGISDKLFGKGPKLGLGMICSFSLPIITLCAMILLMIIISILNFIFFWIPWCFSCIPFPKIKKGGQ